MPVYQITGKNGVVYRVNGPEGLTKEQVVADVLRKFPEAGVPPQKENALEKVPIVGDFLAGAADLPLEFVGGLAGVSKTVTDAFGADNAASDFLENVSKGALDMRSSEARRDSMINALDMKQAEKGGTWEEIKAAGRSFLRSPLDTTASVAGSAAPFIAAGAAGAALAPPTGGASLIPIASMLGLGAVSGTGMIKGDIYDAVYDATYETALESGIDERTAKAKAEKAAETAQEYGGKNTDQIALGSVLGAAASATGFSRQIVNTIGRRAAERVAQRAAQRAAGQTGPGAVRGALVGAGEEAIPEAIQAGQERAAQNIALQREGYDVDTWRGVAGQAAFEGIASLVLGAYGGARSANYERRLLDDTAAEFEAMTPDASEEQVDAAVERFMKRGFNEEVSRTIIEKMQAQKAAIDRQAAEMEQQRQEGMADVEPSTEPNINAPGMVRNEQEFGAPELDPEEEAARLRAYEAEMGGAAAPQPAPAEPARPDFDDFQSDLTTYGNMVANGQLAPTPLVNRLAAQFLDMQGTPAMDALAQSEFGPVVQQFFTNEASALNDVAQQKSRAAQPSQPDIITPSRAGAILNDPVALSDYEAAGGDVEALYEIADSPEPTFSGRTLPQRGRRSKDTVTPDMFAGAPVQEASRLDKAEELAQRKLARSQMTPEELAAEQEQLTAQLDEGQERAQAMRQREEEQREETLGDIEYALRAQAPENAVYKVVYEPDDANPYKLVAETQLGKKPEEVLRAKTLQDFSDQVYGQMMELTPYIPEAPAAIQEVEQRESGEQKYPTAATRMIQEFTAEVDAAREAGLIDNLQRSELLGRLERPNAYRYAANGVDLVPNDAIAKLEKAAIDAASAANNATAEELDALTAVSKEANDRLRAAVQNSLLNPARAKLKSMVEMRQDEKLGARIRRKDAERELDKRMVIMIHGGSDFEVLDKRNLGRGEPGGIRPLGNGFYGYVVDKTNPEEVEKAVNYARHYATKYGRGNKAIHAFQLDMRDAETSFHGQVLNSLQGKRKTASEKLKAARKAYDANPSAEGAWAKLRQAEKDYVNSVDLTVERLPVGLTEGAVNDLGRLERIGKIGLDKSDDELVKAIKQALVEGNERERAASRELRDAKIDRQQLKVQRSQRSTATRMDARTAEDIEAELTGLPSDAVLDWAVETAPNEAFAAIARGVRNAIRRLQKFGMAFDFVVVNDLSKVPAGVKAELLGGAQAVTSPNGFGLTVYLNPASAGYYTGMDYETVLHELVHVATLPYVELGSKPSVKGTRTARLTKDLTDVLAAIKTHLQQRKDSGEPLTPIEQAFFDPASNLFENEDELLAWTLSNSSVMDYLDTVPYKSKQTIFQRLVEVVRNILGLSVSSDAALAEVLRISNQMLYTGDVELARVLTGNPNYRLTYKRSQKKQKQVDEAVGGQSAGARRVNDTQSVYGMEDGINEATEANSKLREGLTYAEDMSPAMRMAILKTMPTSGIMNWLKRKSPVVHDVAKGLVDRVRKMNGLRASLMSSADPLVRKLDDFTRKYGSGALVGLRFTARINGVDPLAFENVEKALAGDAVLAPIEAALLKNSNNKAQTQKLIDEIKEQVSKASDATNAFKDDVRLSTPVRTKLNALTKLAIDNSKVKLKVEQLAIRAQAVADTYRAKEALAQQKGGLALYKAEREYHKDMFDARLALLDERVGEERADRIRDMRAKMMREVQDPEERKKKGDLFWDIDPELFSKDYFPMVREGQYWLRVKEDVDARREERFYTFKSARELAQARRKLTRQLGVGPNSSGVFEEGHNLADLQNTIKGEDALMKRIFEIVDAAKDQYKGTGNVDMRELADEIYQTWLLTTPERSARRRFLHAKEIAGFSPNVLNDFRKQVSTNANEFAKLAYAGIIRSDLEDIRKTIADPQRPSDEAAMLNDFQRELAMRTEQELNPSQHNAIVNAVNRASFFYYLTSAKTALVNFANLPIRVIPRFWRDYGYAEGTAMWLKYMKMWKSLGRVKTEHTKMRFGDYLDANMPNVNGSNFVKNSADLQWAMRAGTERGVLMTTADTIIHSERGNPYAQQRGLVRGVQDLAGNVGKAMSFLFMGTENISRQATFYMTFELELNKFRKENKPEPGEDKESYVKRAREAALSKAVEVVDDTIGNFANWERPRIAKGELTRAFFLFKMHPILQTKFMVGAFRDIIGAPLRGLARQATGRGKMTKEDTAYMAGAMKEFTGVMMMAGLLGGVAGLPLYTAMVQALALALEPDSDDDEDVKKLLQQDAATAYDADFVFRRWLSEKLGVDENGESTLANLVIDGPAGVLTDTEISSTVTLDLAKMWYREPIIGDNLESTMFAAAVANIAGFSMASQVLRGIESAADGDMRDAVKKLSPAFTRSWANAYFNADEGVKSRKGDTIIPKEDITGWDTLRSAIGGRSLRLAKWQDYYITASKKEDRIEKERQEIFDEIEQMRDDGEFKTMADFREYWREVVVPFNRTYPNERFLITEDSIVRSLKGRDERDSRTLDGMLINKKDAARIQRSREMFRPK